MCDPNLLRYLPEEVRRCVGFDIFNVGVLYTDSCTCDMPYRFLRCVRKISLNKLAHAVIETGFISLDYLLIPSVNTKGN